MRRRSALPARLAYANAAPHSRRASTQAVAQDRMSLMPGLSADCRIFCNSNVACRGIRRGRVTRSGRAEGAACRNLTVAPRDVRTPKGEQRSGTPDRLQRAAPLQLLREVPAPGQEADRRPRRLHLRRVHRSLQRDHRRGADRAALVRAREPAEADRDLRRPAGVRRRPGDREADALGRRLQPLQARPDDAERHRGRDRAAEVEHHAARPDRLRQDAARPDAGADPQRPVRDRRRHRAHRGRLRRRGRREHPPEADPGRRLRRQEGRDRDHLHRRDRQDRPQGRQPVDHPRRLRRGRPAGAAEDPRGDHRVGPPAGRAQAPPPGVPDDRHDEHPVHLRRLVRPARPRDRAPDRPPRRRLRRRGRPRRPRRTPASCSSRCCPRT